MNFSGHYQHEAQQGKSGKDSPPTPQFPLCRCITVLTPLILQCVGRAEVGFSKEKLIISPYSCLTVSVQKCYWCLRNDLYKVQRIHDQWKCSVAMVTDVRIVVIKPVNNVRSVHRKSVRVTELLYHPDAKPRIGELLCPVSSHFKLLPGASAVSVSLAYFFSWCLKIVRNNVAGCISALWTANADLAKLEQEPWEIQTSGSGPLLEVRRAGLGGCTISHVLSSVFTSFLLSDWGTFTDGGRFASSRCNHKYNGSQMHFDIPIVPCRVQPSFFFKLACVPYLALFRCSFC